MVARRAGKTRSKTSRVTRVMRQAKKPRQTARGRKSDGDRRALKPGVRRTKHGTTYTETRRNRSD